MNRFENILYVVDVNSQDFPSLKRAVTLAETNDARLTIFDVITEV